MRALNFASRLLLVATLGLFSACSGTASPVASGTGGASSTGGKSSGTGGAGTGGSVGTGGTKSGTGGATEGGVGGSIVKGSGGTTESGTGGATGSGSGGTTGSGSGGSSSGGTTGRPAGGTTGSGSGGSSSGGTTGRPAGGTTGSGSGGTTGGNVPGGTTGTTGGTTGTAGGTTGTAGEYPLGNPAVPSAGCGNALSTFKSGANTTYKMTSASLSREYIMYIPSSYDANKPYRLIFNFHCMGSSDTQCANNDGYYWLKAQDKENTSIFVAPQGYTDSMPWRSDDKDHTFFDDMLKLFKSELCIDESRVFSIGFSFGGMETYSLSVDHQKDLRAAVGIAPANYNIYVPTKTHAPIAWMQTTGMSDTTCPWVNGSSTTQGSKYIAIEHGTDNGCTVPSTIPTWTSGNHLCVDFTGCKAGYPTKICTFNGPHTDVSTESGTNWIPTEAWKFITQF